MAHEACSASQKVGNAAAVTHRAADVQVLIHKQTGAGEEHRAGAEVKVHKIRMHVLEERYSGIAGCGVALHNTGRETCLSVVHVSPVILPNCESRLKLQQKRTQSDRSDV